MSPSFMNTNLLAHSFFHYYSGSLESNGMDRSYGVRPVVNLNSANLTFTGSGTMSDPYVIA